MTISTPVFLYTIVGAVMATSALNLYLYICPLSERATRAESRLEAMRTAIRDGANPRPINCGEYVEQPWAGFVSLGDTWPKDEPRPEVCHLKSEVESLGLVPKGQI
jgi:hypothetical protein